MSPDLSDYERATVERIEGAEAAPESYFVRRIVAEELRAAAKVVNTAVLPDEQAPGMRRATVGLLSSMADDLDGTS